MKSNRRSVGPIPRVPGGENREPVDPVAERISRRVARYQAKTTPERMSALFAAKGERMRENYPR